MDYQTNLTRKVLRKSLLSLDDMVLFKILNHLTVNTLINLGETCKRLEYITQQQFEKHYSSVRWRKNCRNTKLCESREMFRHTGKHIKTINLAMWTDLEFREMLVILANECPSLDTLTLDSIRMNRPIEICHPLVDVMFSKLKRFAITECFWTGWCPLRTFFGENSTLKQLSIIDCCAYNENYKLYLSGFRALKDLCILDCQKLLSSVELQRCFENNSINTLWLCNGNMNIFEKHIIDALYEVESLTLNYNSQIDSKQLVRLTKLKKLRLVCHVLSDVTELLSKLSANIEELEVTNCFITQSVIDPLKKFTNLTHLSFEGGLNSISDEFFKTLPTILPNLQQLIYTYNVVADDAFIYMFRLMPKLRHLSMFGCKSLTIDTYLKMVDILKKDLLRPKLKFIPPQIDSLKTLKHLENVKNVLF